jgi:hypothetical protein
MHLKCLFQELHHIQRSVELNVRKSAGYFLTLLFLSLLFKVGDQRVSSVEMLAPMPMTRSPLQAVL